MSAKKKGKIKNEIKRLMRKKGFRIISEKTHAKFEHIETGKRMCTSISPSCRHAIKQIKRNINKLLEVA